MGYRHSSSSEQWIISHLDQYQEKTVLFRAHNKPWGVGDGSSLGWGIWIKKDLEIVDPPGDHEAILFGPRPGNTACLIQNYLDQF